MIKVPLNHFFSEIYNDEEDKRNDSELIIESAIPIHLQCIKRLSGDDIYPLTWLCKSKSKELFTISVYYTTKYKHEKMFLDHFYLNEDIMSIDRRISCSMILDIENNNIPRYISNLSFFNFDKDYFKLKVVGVNGMDKNKSVNFLVSNELFGSFTYIDNCIIKNIDNYYERQLAILSSSKALEVETDRVYIEEIVSVDNIIITDKKSSSIVVEFKVSDYDNKYSILASFDFGVKLNKHKFGKNKKIVTTEDDLFISIFSMDVKINDNKSSYLLLKTKNKDGKNKLFFLHDTLRLQLENTILKF